MTVIRYTSYNSYAQLHAKGEFEENGHKVHSHYWNLHTGLL